MSLLYYDSSDDDELIDFNPKKDNFNNKDNIKFNDIIIDNKNFSLPPPKKKLFAPPPPPPIDIAPPEISKEVIIAADEKETIIDVDLEEFRNKNQEFAEKNMMIKDSTQFNGVGHDRSKSQLTYLASVDVATRGTFESQIKKSSRSRFKGKQMYGW